MTPAIRVGYVVAEEGLPVLDRAELHPRRVAAPWQPVNHRATRSLVKQNNRILQDALSTLIRDPKTHAAHLRGPSR